MPSSFWGSPAYHVGPYGVPARPGILDRALQLTDIGTNLFGLYQKYKDKSLQDVVKKITVGRSVYGDQPMPVSQDLGRGIEKAGIPWPKVTEEGRQQTLAELMQKGMPGGVGPPDPTKQAQLEAQAPAVGSYQPLPGEAPKTLEAALLKNLQRTGQATPDNLQKMWMAAHGKQAHLYHQPGVGMVDAQGNVISEEPEQTTTIYDQATGQTKQVKGKNVKVTHPWVSPMDVEEKRESNRRGRETTLMGVDPRGIPVPYGTTKGPTKIINQKGAGSEQGVTFITPDEAKANPNKTWPKGTHIIKDDDPAWKGALNQANHMMSSDPASWAMSPEDKAKTQAKIAENIYKESQAAAPGKGTSKGGTSSQAPKQSYTAEQVESEYQNGLKEGRDPAAMKAKRDQLLQGLGGQ